MRSTLLSLVALCGLLSLVGCGGTDARPERSKTYRALSGNLADAMRGVRSFSFHPRARIVRTTDEAIPGTLQRETEAAITRVLGDHGITPSGANRAGDCVIAYAIGITRELGDEELLKIFGIAAGLDIDAESRDRSAERAQRGGIVLAVLDPNRGVVLWRSSGSAPHDPPDSPRRSNASRIERAVRTLFEGLPRR